MSERLPGIRRAATAGLHMLCRGVRRGWCPICETRTLFYKRGSWLRDDLRCIRCENLETQTFADTFFDLVITQDVLEHVLDPARALREIARTLAPWGARVYRETRVRALREHGVVRHLLPPEFHGNPASGGGSLVVREWGRELRDVVREHSGMATAALSMREIVMGIEGEFLDVFVSRKPRGDRVL